MPSPRNCNARAGGAASPSSIPAPAISAQSQLGSVHRLRLIFDANMRSATARGHWERIERLKDRLPLLRYVAVLDDRTRSRHRDWHGTILPVDHPFWATHYPPNGWRCRCMVQQLAEEDLERFGYDPANAGPPARRR